MHGGTEWIVDAFGCDADRLRDRTCLTALLDGIVAALGLHVVGSPQVHGFPDPGGITALYLLSESHLAIHTYPESGIATLNLYCCRDRAALDWHALMVEACGALRVSVRVVTRGDVGRRAVTAGPPAIVVSGASGPGDEPGGSRW